MKADKPTAEPTTMVAASGPVWPHVVAHALFGSLGGYFVYFGTTVQSDKWATVLADNVVSGAASYLMVAGTVLVILACVGLASTRLPRLKRFLVARGVATSALIAIAAMLGWSLYAKAGAAYSDAHVDDLSYLNASSIAKLPSAPIVNLHKYVCDADFQYLCNDAPTTISLEHLVPLNQGRYVPGYGFQYFQNATKDAKLKSPSPDSRGFRAMCQDVPRQVQLFGPAAGLAAQYKLACSVCSRTPEKTVTSLPPFLCSQSSWSSSCVMYAGESLAQSCFIPYVTEPIELGRGVSDKFWFREIFFYAESCCLALAISSSVILLAALFAVFKARRDAWTATDGYSLQA